MAISIVLMSEETGRSFLNKNRFFVYFWWENYCFWSFFQFYSIRQISRCYRWDFCRPNLKDF